MSTAADESGPELEATDPAVGDRDPKLLHAIARATGWAKLALAFHMLVVNGLRIGQVAHPGWVAAASVAMAVWTGYVAWRTVRPNLRTNTLRWLDIIVTAMFVGSSRWMLGEAVLRDGYLGLTCYWMLGTAAEIAIWWGPLSGTLVGGGLGLLQFFQAPSAQPRAWTDMLLMIALPLFLGLLVNELNKTIVDRDRNAAVAASLAERERLNRIVHDGVLQLLAMVAREGSELGPRGQMLAVLARKQEEQLRVTLQDRTVDIDADPVSADLIDLTTMLERHQNHRVTVSTMAGEIWISRTRAREVNAVLTEVLSNVVKHAGPDARAWVLLEQETPDEVILSVRDDGVGMTRDQLQNAADAGRLGVKESIVGRILDLGGSSTVHSSPGKGTEWEFHIPVNEKPRPERDGTEPFEV